MELINHYCHGYVAVAIILNLEKRSVFTYLEQNPSSLEELCEHFHANSGSLKVAFNVLLSLGWLEQDAKKKYSLTEKSAMRHKIPLQLLDLYSYSVVDFFSQAPWQASLDLMANVHLEKNSQPELFYNMLKGVILAPLLLSLHQLDIFKETGLSENSRALLGEDFSRIIDLFTQEKWLSATLSYKPLGAYLFKRTALMAVTISYQPMFAKLNEILFGDFASIFGKNADGSEKHIDRNLNVIGSGAQHELFFEQFKSQVRAVFNNTNFENQPAYIADMGCGDGSLLKKLYAFIREETPRGKVFDTYPLTMIGADFNEASLQATKKTLEKNSVPYITIQADIGDPHQFIQNLKSQHINPDHILHIRSFLDHDRPYIAPDINNSSMRKHYQHQGLFVDQQGKEIVSEIMMQSLVEHLGRWGSINIGHGLILSEVHYLSPDIVRRYVGESENLSFDACQGLSKQYLVTMPDFLLAAAENGLFTSIDAFMVFPKNSAFSRIDCLRLEKRIYTIRYAHLSDIERLMQLEKRCDHHALSNEPDTIKQRLQHNPQGHWVLEINKKIIGAIYTQRLHSIAEVCHQSENTIDSLHHPHGKIMQILKMMVDPEYHHFPYASELRDFALLIARATPGIVDVISVTRCQSYVENRGRYTNLTEYIQAKDNAGLPIDPLLHFHASRKAIIEGLIANYRSHDVDNNKAGVLVRYSLEKLFT